ncbi:MAG: hypothetical protein GKR90_17565 [Pseudomonadales bacterium]|nr:hypothetical protein [Pseudomonadales bacterium]
MRDSLLKFAEVLASVAVILSLAVLIYEVRENSSALERNNSIAKAAALDEGSEQYSEFRRLLIGNRDLTELWLKGNRGDELDEVDSDRFGRLVAEWTIIMRNHYVRNATVGNYEIATLTVSRLADNLLARPGLRSAWELLPHSKEDPTGFAAAVELEVRKRMNSRGGG